MIINIFDFKSKRISIVKVSKKQKHEYEMNFELILLSS